MNHSALFCFIFFLSSMIYDIFTISLLFKLYAQVYPTVVCVCDGFYYSIDAEDNSCKKKRLWASANQTLSCILSLIVLLYFVVI